ncbi:pyridoxamine 5'-phosphate oxidase family protein [Nocardia sp. NPDC003963]
MSGADESLGPRLIVEIGRAEALRLLGSTSLGRIVYTDDALPAVRAVNHLLDPDGSLIIRTTPFSGLDGSLRGRPVVVAYEADDIDPVRRIGWAVLITGPARVLTPGELAAEYTRRLGLWGDQAAGMVIGIDPVLVSGTRLIEEVAV